MPPEKKAFSSFWTGGTLQSYEAVWADTTLAPCNHFWITLRRFRRRHTVRN
jgi:hypothetical protein